MFEEIEEKLQEIECGFDELEMVEDELANIEMSLEVLEELGYPIVTEFFKKFNSAQKKLQEAMDLVPKIKKTLPLNKYFDINIRKSNTKMTDKALIFIRTKTGAKKDAVIVQGSFTDKDQAESFLRNAIETQKSFQNRQPKPNL